MSCKVGWIIGRWNLSHKWEAIKNVDAGKIEGSKSIVLYKWQHWLLGACLHSRASGIEYKSGDVMLQLYKTPVRLHVF